MTEILLRVTVLLMAAMLVALALRRASAALRHLVWTLSLAGALLIPLCSCALPTWQWAILPPRTPAPPAIAPADEEMAGGSSLRSTPPYNSPQGSARNPASAVRFLATFHGNCAGRGPGNSAHGRGSSRRGPDSARVVLAGAACRGLGGREFLGACLAGDRRRGGVVCCPAGQVRPRTRIGIPSCGNCSARAASAVRLPSASALRCRSR